MYTTYHLRADELNDEVVQILKDTYRQNEIVILPKDVYAEIEKSQHNLAFTEKLQQRIKALDEGKGIVKTMAELEAMENE
jgi:transcriptional regulator